MSRYLITGIAGFIGSSVARALIQLGDEVRGLDNFSTGNRANIAEIIDKLDFLEVDLLDLNAMRQACEGVDFVLHQAAIPSVPKSISDPHTSNRVNVDGTVNVLIAARDAKVKRVVYAASSSAYGDQPTLPKHEAMTPDPISPYAVAKYSGEMYMKSFYRCYGLETVSLRYFNVFGPRQDPKSEYAAVIPKFITAALAGQTPRIFGDGTQSRDFCHIDNIIEANFKAASAPAAQVSGQVFNIACGVATDLNQVVAVISDILGKKIEPRHEAERAGDIKHSYADIGKARQRLGYTASVSFADGLRRTLEWYRSEGPASS